MGTNTRGPIRTKGFAKKWCAICGSLTLVLGLILTQAPVNTYFHMEYCYDDMTDCLPLDGVGLPLIIFGVIAVIGSVVRFNPGSRRVMVSFAFVAAGTVLAMIPIGFASSQKVCISIYCFTPLWYIAVGGVFMAIFASIKVAIRSCRRG